MPSVAIMGSRGYPSYYGGFETAVRYIAPYLVDKGWDVTVLGRRGVATQRSHADPRVRVIETAGVDSKSLSTLSYGLTSSLAVARQKPDAVLVLNCANGFFLPLLRARGIPTVVNVDGIEWERDKWGKVAKAVFRAGAAMTAHFADELIVDAEAIGRYWQDKFNRVGHWAPYGGEPREELPVPEGLVSRGYVLAVARLVPENSVPEFIEAARIVARSQPVVLVGSTGFGGELDEAARSLDELELGFTWLGHVADDDKLHALWQHAGAYFHGHSVGGTNPALVQAMALGAPTIARDTPFNREVLAEAGRYSALDARTLAESLLALLADRAGQEELSRMAKQRAAEHFTWEGVCARYEDVLRKTARSDA